MEKLSNEMLSECQGGCIILLSVMSKLFLRFSRRLRSLTYLWY